MSDDLLKSWKTRASRQVFDAAPYVEVRVETVELPDGRLIDDYYQVNLSPFAIIVTEMHDGRFVMLRQYKHGPKSVSLTFPAGYVEPGEPALHAAQRELLEETGCVADSWQAMGVFTDNGNQGGSQGSFFLARGCRKVQGANSGDLEVMQEVLLSAQELDAAMQNGGFAITHHVAAWGLARLYL